MRVCFHIFVAVAGLLVQEVNNAALSDYELKNYKQYLEGQGLYTADDDVVVLTVRNFKNEVMGKPYAFLVEFYNSWCGFCQRFAPSWKALATDVKGWEDLVRVGALDCSVDENAPICREYEIMGYPTLRYFHENYVKGPQNLGVSVPKGEDLQGHKKFLIDRLITEQSEGRAKMIANILPYNYSDLTHLFDNTSAETIQYAFLIIEKPETYLGIDVILDLHKTPNITIRYSQTTNALLIEKYGLDKFPVLISQDRSGSRRIHHIDDVNNRGQLKVVLKQYLESKKIPITDETPKKEIFTGKWLDVEVPNMASLIKERARQALKERVKNMGDAVFQMDLETALRYSLKHEIATTRIIEGEKLEVLQNYLRVLRKYFPFGQKGQLFLSELLMAVSDVNSVQGDTIALIVARAEQDSAEVFSSPQQWLACRGSVPGKRGYPCGLWKLFHYLTVNSAEQNNRKANALEILDVMFGYIKNYFGCSDCSQHFQEMAVRREMRNISSLDSSVIWLWMAHNEVNKRLSGDQTEDPEYPKYQFPSKEHCPSCRNTDDTWNLSEVLRYVKHVYSSINVRYIGSDTTVLHLGVEGKADGKSGSKGIFQAPDMSMCFILYVVSFLLLALLIRMFLKRRGYRKKPYVHDLLGKV